MDDVILRSISVSAYLILPLFAFLICFTSFFFLSFFPFFLAFIFCFCYHTLLSVMAKSAGNSGRRGRMIVWPLKIKVARHVSPCYLNLLKLSRKSVTNSRKSSSLLPSLSYWKTSLSNSSTVKTSRRDSSAPHIAS